MNHLKLWPYCGGFILILLCALISSNESASTSSALLSGIRKMRPRFFQRQFQFGKRTLNQRKKASWKDKRTSVFKSIFSPSQSTRRQFPITKRIINLSDPLHAYPNKADLTVHDLFQKTATFEINNAAAVRTLLNSARISFWIGLVLGTVGLAVPLSTAIPGPLRVSNEGAEEKANQLVDRYSSEYWKYVDHIAESIVHAIENGNLQYNF